MFDKETGRSRGYGFCEFLDSFTAECAIRNLSGFEFKGRTLKVDFADNQSPQQGHEQFSKMDSNIISSSLYDDGKSQSDQQSLDMLLHFKGLAMQNYDHARSILHSNPELAYSLIKSLVKFNELDANLLNSLLITSLDDMGNQEKRENLVKEDDNAALYKLLALSDEDVRKLPPEQRAQILEIVQFLLINFRNQNYLLDK